jgi:hypothetical protein
MKHNATVQSHLDAEDTMEHRWSCPECGQQGPGIYDHDRALEQAERHNATMNADGYQAHLDTTVTVSRRQLMDARDRLHLAIRELEKIPAAADHKDGHALFDAYVQIELAAADLVLAATQ